MTLDTSSPMNYKSALTQIVPTTGNIVHIPVGSTNEYMCFDETSTQGNNQEDSIVLTEEEKERIHRPWAYSVIIRLIKIQINHAYLKTRLSALWKPNEELILINLGNYYFIVKFLEEENMLTALQKGPWFINGAFQSVRKWHPNFVASEAMEKFTVIWIWLPKLPTEYYDHSILSKIGSKMGRLVKTDICTLATLKGRTIGGDDSDLLDTSGSDEPISIIMGGDGTSRTSTCNDGLYGQQGGHAHS
ncbi:hypothetical protein FXO37_20358 [Capsicum annuum]|nr:hypothetical protein FXO37_20358 [Capsicum annuum]